MSKLEQVLDDCLTRLSNDETTLEECLESYPAYAEELRRLLVTADRLQQGRMLHPSPTFKSRTRAQLIAHVNANPRRRSAWRWLARLSFPRFPIALGRALNFGFGLIGLVLLFLTTGTVLAQSAGPGEALYDWRLASEQVLRAIHPDPLTVDLFIVDRQTDDLTQLKDRNSETEQLVLQSYEDTLTELAALYTDLASQQRISQALAEQKSSLERANLVVPELNELLESANLWLKHEAVAVEEGRITYSLTITNHGPASPITATVVNTLSPVETFVASRGGNCISSDAGQVNCTVGNLSTGAPHNLMVTTAIAPCYAGVITNTAIVTGTPQVINRNPDNQSLAESRLDLPFPGYQRVAYVQSNGQAHDLNLITSAAPDVNLNFHLRAAAPAGSPDGAKIAFFGEEGISELGGVYGQGNGVWVVDITDGQAYDPSQLVAQDHVKNIAWSLDGTKLAFEVGEPGLTHEVLVVDSRDGQLISQFSGQHPAWSPDSQKVVTKSCNPQCGLWEFNFDGRDGRQLTFDETDSYPAYAPTGEYLAFTSNRDNDWEIYRLRLADDQLLRLTNRPGSDVTPVFGRCGQEIYLRTDHFGGWRIMVMKLDGSDERLVREGVGPSDDWGLARPSIY